MNILLERFAYMPKATLGKFILNDETFYTVEQPYKNNLPYHSAVPDGLYKLIPHNTSKKSVPGAKCYALENHALNVYHLPAQIPDELQGVARFACLFTHIANYPRHVEGCIGTGLKMGEHDTIYDTQSKLWVNGVSSSRRAVVRVLSILGTDKEQHTLEIVPTKGAVI